MTARFRIITALTPSSAGERKQADDPEREEGERFAGDQAAADEGHRVHVARLAGVCRAAAAQRVPGGGDDAAETERERGPPFDGAAEARGIGTRDDDGVDDEVRGAAAAAAQLPRLVARAVVEDFAQHLGDD